MGAEVKVEVTRYGIMRCMGVEIYQLIDVKSYYIPKSLVDARLTKHCEFLELPYILDSHAQCVCYLDAALRYKAVLHDVGVQQFALVGSPGAAYWHATRVY